MRMRISIAVALVACGGSTQPTRQPTVHDAGTDATAVIEDAEPVAARSDVVSIDDISMETTSQTPGRHPRVPGSPHQDVDKQHVRDVIRQHTSDLLDCYRKLSPDAFPAIHLEFTIRPDGRVARASATGAQGELDACVVKVLDATRFPTPAGGASIVVSYPLSFDPVASGE